MNTGSSLSDLVHSDFLDILEDGSAYNDMFYKQGIVQDVSSLEANLNKLNEGDILYESQFSLSSLEGFNANFSTSESSLSDPNSPNQLSFSTDYQNGYTYQNSPDTASMDSGVTSSPSISESPQLSPGSGNGYYLNYADSYDNKTPLNGKNEELLSQGALSGDHAQLLVKLINQQVQQALVQHQQQLMQQQPLQQPQQQEEHTLSHQKENLALMQMQLQQQIQRLTQQQQQQQQQKQLQQQLIQEQTQQSNHRGHQQLPLNHEALFQQDNIQEASSQSKSDSQLRKMLMQTKTNFAQTKNTIINSINDTKGKISNFKFPKPGMKPNKRKGLPALDDSPKLAKKIDNSVAPYPTSPCLQYPDGTEGIMYNDNILPLTQQLGATSELNSSQVSSLLTNYMDSDSSIASPSAVFQQSKVPISRLSTNSSMNPAISKVSKTGNKRTRVEHVVIEKRYRMKITDSLNELKIMLNCHDEKKATKNSVLQAAIDEIKRLRKANDSMAKKNKKMRKLFEELRSIGIIPMSQTVSSSGSESNNTEENNQRVETMDDDLEPEVNQDHYASPFQRQSTRDAGKLLTCFTIFLFLFMNPLAYFGIQNDVSKNMHYQSRHLLSTKTTQEASPQYYLVTNLINIILSFFILLFIVLRGNPHSSKLAKNSKLAVCYTSQLRKAQLKINKHEYDDAKDFLRIALFVVGNSCPKTTYGQLASFLWKCCCHILYQLGVVTAMETIGRTILPSSISQADEKKDREFAAKLSAEAYRKLHEVAVKDGNSTYMETACYLMNFLFSAEASGDCEVLCTAYATAVVHMKEKVTYPSLLQYYFTGCAHHVSLASKDEYPFAIDWIFENRGYEYFANGSWNVRKCSQFYVHCGDSDLDEPDLLQLVYAQYQDYLLSKALKRIVAPETFYPNEGKIELRQRALSFLNTVVVGPASEHLDNMSIYQQSLYGWWGATLKHLLSLMKHVSSNGTESNDLVRLQELFENIHERHRHEIIDLMKTVTTVYTGVKLLEQNSKTMLPSDEHSTYVVIKGDMKQATQLLQSYYNNKQKTDTAAVNEEENEQIDINELILLLCCDLMLESRYLLWKIGCFKMSNNEQLTEMMVENQMLLAYTNKYLELENKVQQHDYQIQLIAGVNHTRVEHVIRRTHHIDKVCSKTNEIDYYNYDYQQYPVKFSCR